MNYFDEVVDFHYKFGLPVLVVPQIPSAERQALRRELVKEEYKELLKGLDEQDLVEIADGCVDLIYVVCGLAAEYGIPLNEVFEEVQRSNLAKLGPNGQPIYREDGKVVKPEGWVKPDIKSILASRAELF